MIEPQFKTFERGEVIVAEGSKGNEVFLLTEGQAKVTVRGIEVGKINEEEIFCVKSALTNTPRTATIVCDADRCFSMSIPKEQFKELIRDKPELVEKLIEDLVRIISELNERVVSTESSNLNIT